MSHIPSSAMPHAKPHEHETEPEPAVAVATEAVKPVVADAVAATKRVPWWALAAGGVLAVGLAVGVTAASRPAVKPKRRKAATPKPRRRRTKTD